MCDYGVSGEIGRLYDHWLLSRVISSPKKMNTVNPKPATIPAMTPCSSPPSASQAIAAKTKAMAMPPATDMANIFRMLNTTPRPWLRHTKTTNTYGNRAMRNSDP